MTTVDPFAAMIQEKLADMKLSNDAEVAAKKKAASEQRRINKEEAAEELHTILKSHMSHEVVMFEKAPSVYLDGCEPTDFRIYTCPSKAGNKMRIFVRSTTWLDEEIMRDIFKNVCGDEFRIDNKDKGQFQISGISWDYVPELIEKLCREAREWL